MIAGSRSFFPRSFGKTLTRVFRPSRQRTRISPPPPTSRAPLSPAPPGDFRGHPRIEYDPHPDGLPDPGEIVWTWVPFEETPEQGKDRPVLLIGRDGDRLLGLMLTSKDHDRDPAREARHGRSWYDIGTGAWDASRRPSEVRLDRVLRVDPAAVRREGAVLDARTFAEIADRVRQVRG